MDEIRIRRMQYRDVGQVEAIERATFARPWSEESLRREVKENPEGVHDTLIPGTAEEGREVIFQLYRGSYIYDVVINEPYETYRELEGSWVDDSRTVWQEGDYDSLTIKRISYRCPNAY